VSCATYRFLPPRSRSEVEVKCRYCVCLRKRQIYHSLVKLWISLSGVEENLIKDENTGVQHVTGVFCTLAVLLLVKFVICTESESYHGEQYLQACIMLNKQKMLCMYTYMYICGAKSRQCLPCTSYITLFNLFIQMQHSTT